jgi:hypothetical protein
MSQRTKRLAAQQRDELIDKAASDLTESIVRVRWYWVLGEVAIEKEDHECTADCDHWKNEVTNGHSTLAD